MSRDTLCMPAGAGRRWEGSTGDRDTEVRCPFRCYLGSVVTRVCGSSPFGAGAERRAHPELWHAASLGVKAGAVSARCLTRQSR